MNTTQEPTNGASERAAGWYPDERDANVTRYWDGAAWTAQRVWDGSTWVAPEATATDSLRVAAATISAAAARLDGRLPRATRFWTLAGGAAGVAIASLLPWAEASGPYGGVMKSGPQSGATFLFFVLAAGVVALGWPLLTGGIGKLRAAGMSAVVGLLTVFMFSNWSALGEAQQKSSQSFLGVTKTVELQPGAGLLLYTLAVLVLWAAVALAWFGKRDA
jgi:hypothetical protein